MTRWMLRASILLGALSLAPGSIAALESERGGQAARILVFVDGTRMPVQSFEIKERMVQFMSLEGKLRSVPRSYVNIPATEAGGAPAQTRRPAPPPAPPTGLNARRASTFGPSAGVRNRCASWKETTPCTLARGS